MSGASARMLRPGSCGDLGAGFGLGGLGLGGLGLVLWPFFGEPPNVRPSRAALLIKALRVKATPNSVDNFREDSPADSFPAIHSRRRAVASRVHLLEAKRVTARPSASRRSHCPNR